MFYKNIYSSYYFILFWIILSATSLIYIFKTKLYKRWKTLILHLSFILILVGACVTSFTSESGHLKLRKNENCSFFINSNNEMVKLPFDITLKEFRTEFYKGTNTPVDYISNLAILKNDTISTEGVTSMTNVFSFENYRFYQAYYVSDNNGVTLTLAYVPYEIIIT